VGDYVLAYDEASGAVGFYPVTAVWVHEDPVILLLTIDGEVVETTPEHPFYTEDGVWVAAGALEESAIGRSEYSHSSSRANCTQ
jgi:intein/homing endonuclease